MHNARPAIQKAFTGGKLNQPKYIPQLSEKDIARFWSKVDIRGADECWLWKYSTNRLGYGKFQIGARYQVRAHRVAFTLMEGDPGTLMVLHTCDNPPCCNPYHLFKGGPDDNMTDKTQKGRASKGEQCRKKCRTAEVIEMRELHREGMSMNAISELYGVTRQNVWHIIHRITWKHV